MLNSILYFEQFCIKNFEKLEDEFLKNPENFAEYVFGLTDLLCKFGTEMLRDSLETMDRMLCESTFRRKSWTIEAHHTKTLVTSLGDVTFQKTLFLNKQTKQRAYLLDQILGLEPKQRLTEDAAARMLEEAVLTDDWFSDRVIRHCIMVSAHIADGLTACSHFRSHDRFQPLDIGLQFF